MQGGFDGVLYTHPFTISRYTNNVFVHERLVFILCDAVAWTVKLQSHTCSIQIEVT